MQFLIALLSRVQRMSICNTSENCMSDSLIVRPTNSAYTGGAEVGNFSALINPSIRIPILSSSYHLFQQPLKRSYISIVHLPSSPTHDFLLLFPRFVSIPRIPFHPPSA